MGLIDTAARMDVKKNYIKSSLIEKKEAFNTFRQDPHTYINDKWAAAKRRSAENTSANEVELKTNEDIEKKKLDKKEEKVADAELKRLRDAGRNVGGPGYGASERNPEESRLFVLFILTLIAHFFDVYSHFSRPGVIIYFYLGLVIYVIIFQYGFHRITADEGEFLGLVAFAYLLPFIPGYIPNNAIALIATGTICFFPILALYFALKYPEHRKINILARWYIAFWLIVLVFNIFTAFAPSQNIQALKTDPLTGMRYVLTGIGTTFSKIGSDMSNSVNMAIAQATGQPYQSSQESQVGVYIQNMRPLDSTYTPDSDIIVESTLSTVNVKEPIDISMLCYVQGHGEGNISPQMLTSIGGNYQNVVDCNMGKLAKGAYDVHVRADFTFSTTTDVTYTFATPSVIRANALADTGQSSSSAGALTIPTSTASNTAQPISSGGPVSLGLPTLTQPLMVDPSKGNSQLSNSLFGVSLMNNWPQGKIIRGIKYVLDVPAEISLIDCSRNLTSKDSITESGGLNRNVYTFDINSINAQGTFDSIRCRMQIDDVNSLLRGDTVSTRTFAAKATYEYAVESSTPVTVNS